MKQNRGPEINPRLYSQLIFNRGSKHIQWEKDSLFNKQCWENWTDTHQNNETRPPSYTTHRINSKWIKNLNVRPETIKILEENIGSKILDIAWSNILLYISPQAMETEEKINKWDYVRLKTFCTAKEIINKIKRQSTE